MNDAEKSALSGAMVALTSVLVHIVSKHGTTWAAASEEDRRMFLSASASCARAAEILHGLALGNQADNDER